MHHAVVARVLDGNTCPPKARCVGLTFVAQRVVARGQNKRRSDSLQVGGAQRRDLRVVRTLESGYVETPESLHRRLFEAIARAVLSV